MAVRYRVAGRIPDVLLPRVGDGIPVPARGRPREAVVYLFLTEPAGWAEYVRRVAEHRSEFADWDGRIVAVTSGPGAPWRPLADQLGESVWIVEDPDRRLASGGEDGPPRAAVADRYGEIYHVWSDDALPLPEPRELEEWLQFLALQCPE